MRFDEQTTTYLRNIADNLRSAMETSDTYYIAVACARHVAGQIDALLDLKGYDADIPEPILKKERKHYPTAKTEVYVGENRDLPHRIPGYRDYYASPLGRIWSYKTGKWLKHQTQSGKPRVRLWNRGLEYSELVARLVLLTHDISDIGVKVGASIGYRDGDPLNVRLDNLFFA